MSDTQMETLIAMETAENEPKPVYTNKQRKQAVKILRNKITKAFTYLRKLGYFSKQNHTCCMSCGIAEVPEDKKLYVFYHNQDFTQLIDECSRENLYLCYEGRPNLIVEVLKLSGIKVNWDGDEGKKIECVVEYI
jgi:hypothetical protein